MSGSMLVRRISPCPPKAAATDFTSAATRSDHIGRRFGLPVATIQPPAEFDRQVAPLDKAGFAQALSEGCQHIGVACRHAATEEPDHRQRPLLRARRERPKIRRHGRRAAEEGDELAALHWCSRHSMTSSARSRIEVGTSSPSALAVFMLSTVSYFTGACTGRSAGFSPFRMRST